MTTPQEITHAADDDSDVTRSDFPCCDPRAVTPTVGWLVENAARDAYRREGVYEQPGCPWDLLFDSERAHWRQDVAPTVKAVLAALPGQQCSCGTTYADYEGPQEDCHVHGRPYSEWVQIARLAQHQRDSAESEAVALSVKLGRVRALHQRENLYDVCSAVACERDHFEVNAGELLHDDEVIAVVCSECHDEDGDATHYPCPTIAALDGVSTDGE